MIKVTLLGDSIRLIGYGSVVAERLSDEFEVWQPEDNCRFAQYTLRGLFDWKGKMAGSSIVHWNNGLWDICELFDDGPFTPLEEYLKQMERVADILLARYETVIFATTTPVTAQNKYNKNEMIYAYNDAVVSMLRKKGVIINDLCSLVSADIDRYICEDNIHLSQDGIELCAEAVVRAVRNAAEELSGRETDAKNSKDSNGAPV